MTYDACCLPKTKLVTIEATELKQLLSNSKKLGIFGKLRFGLLLTAMFRRWL
jgi:hypothetical protein